MDISATASPRRRSNGNNQERRQINQEKSRDNDSARHPEQAKEDHNRTRE